MAPSNSAEVCAYGCPSNVMVPLEGVEGADLEPTRAEVLTDVRTYKRDFKLSVLQHPND